MASTSKGFFSALSYIPTIITNNFRDTLHNFFPTKVEEVCAHPSDFICHGTNGVAKLADSLPEWFMNATDVIYDNPYKTLGTLALGTTLAGLYFCYGRQQHSERVPGASSNTDVHEQQQQEQKLSKPFRKHTHHRTQAQDESEPNSVASENALDKKEKKKKKKKRATLSSGGDDD